MQKLFRPKALKSYLTTINQVLDQTFHQWQQKKKVPVYWGVKSMALNIASKSFLNLDPQGENAKKLNRSFIDMVEASVCVVRKPILNNAFAKGLRGRRYIETLFRSMIDAKRVSDSGDMFTYLCQAKHENGEFFTEDEIVNHMVFLLMAAHDTVTSTLSSLLYFLDDSPQWVDNIRQETGSVAGQDLGYEHLGQFKTLEWTMNESLRLLPPVHSIPRQAVKDTLVHDIRIPKGTPIGANIYLTHRDPKWWTKPSQFDPERFAEGRAEHKQHSYLYLPFGGGSHRCLGLVFANMLVKSFLCKFLNRFDFDIKTSWNTRINLVPIPKPLGPMILQVKPRNK